MFSSKNLAAAAKGRMRRRSLDVPISGKGGYIDCGEHDVQITDVDLGKIDSGGAIDFTFQDASLAKHTQRVWILRNGIDEYSSAIVNLVNSVFRDPTVYELLDQLIANPDLQEGTFQAFRGLHVKINLARTDGYSISQQEGKFVIADVHTDKLLDDREFSRLSEARDVAVARKFKRSFRRVKRYESLDDVTLSKNRKNFDNAIVGMLAAAKSVSNIRQLFDPNIMLED